MKIKFIFLTLILLLLSGCASYSYEPREITVTHEAVFLKDKNKGAREALLKAFASNGKVYDIPRFYSPKQNRLNEYSGIRNTLHFREDVKTGAVFLFPGKNEKLHQLIMSDDKLCLRLIAKVLFTNFASECIDLSAYEDYWTSTENIKILERELSKLVPTRDRLRNELQSTKNTLLGIPSYSNKTCNLLKQKPLPVRPATACDSRQKYERTQIACLSSLGAMGCSMALEEAKKQRGQKANKIEKFLASSTCSSLLKGQVSRDDMALATMETLGDWASESNMDVLSFAGKALSGFSKGLKVVKSYSCLAGIEGSCKRLISDWEKTKKEIIEFPKKNLALCKETDATIAVLAIQVTALNTTINAKTNELDAFQIKLRHAQSSVISISTQSTNKGVEAIDWIVI